ncbi:MAG: sterol carrier protein domain-containing protein [Dehalococcoidia bacterium]|nr:sterol carrier protein domain-containing protein [Dehalococcoidia bacterium]
MPSGTTFGEWNDATFELAVEGDDASVRRTTEAPDLSMPVGTLASLLSGHRKASAMVRAGKLGTASIRPDRRGWPTGYSRRTMRPSRRPL